MRTFHLRTAYNRSNRGEELPKTLNLMGYVKLRQTMATQATAKVEDSLMRGSGLYAIPGCDEI